MDFQKLFGPLTKPREDKFLDEIIGHEHIKRLFGLVLRSEITNHLLLSGPPASAKTKPYVLATTCEGFIFYRWRKQHKSRNNRSFVQEPCALSSNR
jgi:hypothetical protein